jgi:hypothetical protein
MRLSSRSICRLITVSWIKLGNVQYIGGLYRGEKGQHVQLENETSRHGPCEHHSATWALSTEMDVQVSSGPSIMAQAQPRPEAIVLATGSFVGVDLSVGDVLQCTVAMGGLLQAVQLGQRCAAYQAGQLLDLNSFGLLLMSTH